MPMRGNSSSFETMTGRPGATGRETARRTRGSPKSEQRVVSRATCPVLVPTNQSSPSRVPTTAVHGSFSPSARSCHSPVAVSNTHAGQPSKVMQMNACPRRSW